MDKTIFKLPDFLEIMIEISTSIWTTKTIVLANGVPLERIGESRRSFWLPLPDGSNQKMDIYRTGIDYLPKVYLDGEKIEIVRRLRWYEKAAGFIPGVLFLGGVLGGICGYYGITANYKILRGEKSNLYKFLAVSGITILTIIIYFILALIYQLISNFLFHNS